MGGACAPGSEGYTGPLCPALPSSLSSGQPGGMSLGSEVWKRVLGRLQESPDAVSLVRGGRPVAIWMNARTIICVRRCSHSHGGRERSWRRNGHSWRREHRCRPGEFCDCPLSVRPPTSHQTSVGAVGARPAHCPVPSAQCRAVWRKPISRPVSMSFTVLSTGRVGPRLTRSPCGCSRIRTPPARPRPGPGLNPTRGRALDRSRTRDPSVLGLTLLPGQMGRRDRIYAATCQNLVIVFTCPLDLPSNVASL